MITFVLKKNNVFRTRIYMRRSTIWFLMHMSLQLDDCREWVERPHPACGTFAPSAVYLRWNGAVCIADSARYWNLIWNTMFSKCGFTLVFTFWLITFSSENLGFLFNTSCIEDSLVKHITVFKSQNHFKVNLHYVKTNVIEDSNFKWNDS